MKHHKLSPQELKILEDLYMEGALSREEEKALYLILESDPDLSRKDKDFFKILEIERKVFATSSQKKNFRIPYMAAAAVLMVFAVAFISIKFSYSSPAGSEYTVWQNGEKLSEDEAKKIAEENQQIDMEMIREVMRNQREMLKRNFASVNMEEYDL